MNSIILYTTNCPKCKVVETKLNNLNISYTTCTDVDKMIELGIQSAPALEVNGTLMDFKQTINWLKEQ